MVSVEEQLHDLRVMTHDLALARQTLDQLCDGMDAIIRDCGSAIGRNDPTLKPSDGRLGLMITALETVICELESFMVVIPRRRGNV
jgi:hypothetical protein